MDDKAAREAFRVRQYSGSEAGPSRRNAVPPRELGPNFTLSTSRCIIHFDVDAFYAQVWYFIEHDFDPRHSSYLA